MLRDLRAAARIVHATGHGLKGLWLIRRHFPRWTQAEREACTERWAARMLAILNIGLRVEGQRPAGGPLLLVSNHTSWLDILAIQSARRSRFIAKSEIRAWPLVGVVAAGAGTLFIERASRRDALRTVHRTAEALAAGDIVAVFPEGTTGDGSRLLPFHGNLLQAAISSGAAALPVGVHFVDAASGQRSGVATYIDDDTLIGSLWRTLRAEPLCAVVHFGRPQQADGRDRREWAEALHAEVDGLRR
ncbi:1-acyl-sn-glycerol-3-phosphate acyltransferase [Xylophilus rhododendri]|uniref:1-acyl-sn-glycerol-3-phosphate acyltransferase n=1 Tax=Xylophilus rhododendri TaxID=2697032 RepID=A0A857JE59_9BURK|nr:lysophospholipid acyltransferase family protein [Xylophilus rhododendri]QHJ01482.1 1-acyl-sn-glycerol-3-phosphate acyltransferase [Xylophilus rhododendri]